MNVIQSIIANPYLTGIILLNLIAIVAMVWIHRRIKSEQELLENRLSPQLDEKEAVPHTQFIHEWNSWLQKESTVSQLFRETWSDYYRSFLRRNKQDRDSFPDIYDYFLEEEFVQKRGGTPFFRIVSGTFLAIGILGTFWGLIAELGQHSGILPSGGIEDAFTCSLFGVVSAVVWQFLERLHRLILQSKFSRMRNMLDEVFPSLDVNTQLHQLTKSQNEIKQYMEEQLIPQVTTAMVDALGAKLLPRLQETQEAMEQVVRNCSQQTLLVKEMMSSIHEITGEHMSEVKTSLRETVELQQTIQKEMEQLTKKLHSSVDKQDSVLQQTTTISQEMKQYTSQLSTYQGSLQTTTAKIEESIMKSQAMHDTATELLTNMVKEREAIDKLMKSQGEMLQQNTAMISKQTRIQNELHKEYLQLTEQWNERLRQMKSLCNEQSTLIEKAQGHNYTTLDLQTNLHTLLTRLEQSGKQYLELTSDLLTEKDKLSRIQAQMHDQLTNHLEQIDQRIEKMQTNWTNTQLLFAEINQQLGESMGAFTKQLQQGLNHNLSQFDDELTKSIHLLSTWVGTLQDLLQDYPDHLEKLNHLIADWNLRIEETSKKMSKSDDYVTE